MNARYFSVAAFVVALAAAAAPSVLSAGEVKAADSERSTAAAWAVLQKRKADFVAAAIAFAKATEAELVEQRNHLWQRLGIMRQALAAWDEAISGLERGAIPDGSDRERRIILGRAYLERGRAGDGLTTLLAAEQLEPHRADVQMLLGEAYRRAGRLEKAAKSFRQASLLDPKDLLSSYWLGQILSKLGQTEPAREARQQFHDRRLELARLAAVASPVGTSLAIAETPDERLDRPSSLQLYFLRAPYRQAATLLRQGRYDEAVSAFAEAASKDAVASAAYLHLSGADGDGKLAKALDDERRAVQTNPDDARRHFQLGEAYLATSRHEEARASFEKALVLDQELDAARLLLGHLALQAGKLDLAQVHFEQAVQRTPDIVEARKLLGAVLAMNGRTEHAIEHYRAAIRLRPDDEQARMGLAATFIKARRYAEAEHELLEAARAIPDSGQAVFNVGRLYMALGRQADAITMFEKAAASYPAFRRADLYALIAGTYDNQLRSDQAVAAYLQALEANPSYVTIHAALAHLYLRRNLYDEALAELTAILVLHPQHAEAHTRMAQTYLRMGRYTDAAEAAGRALRLRPDHRDARYALGQALLRLGRLEDGRAELRKFQERQASSLADEHRVRGFVALQQEALASVAIGDHDKAIRLFRRISEQQPHFGYWHLILARVLALAGRHDEALQSLEKARELSQGALEMHRDFAEVYRGLGRIEDSEREHRAYLLEQEQRRRKAVENALR